MWAVTLPSATDTAKDPTLDVPGGYFVAYPNPTTSTLTLAYELSTPSPVRIELIDLLGRVVRVVEQGASGDRVELSTEGLGAGVYVARLTAGSVRESRTITVVR